MADELRYARRKQPKYFVANRGSESEGDSEDERGRPHPALIPQPYPSKAPYPAQPHPPSLTTDFSSHYVPDFNSHPPLSSPSSPSSQAADESTPPPATPGSMLPSSSNPSVLIKPSHQSQESIVYVDRYTNDHNPTSTSRTHKLMNSFKSFTRQPRTPIDSRRPSTSPVVSTSDPPAPSSSYTPPASFPPQLDGVILFVSVDSEPDRFNTVDVSGAKDGSGIRKLIFSKFNISGDDQRFLSIHRTEIGSFILGGPLSDERLYEQVRRYGDGKGTLKFIVARMPSNGYDQAPQFTPPASQHSQPPLHMSQPHAAPPLSYPSQVSMIDPVFAPLRPAKRHSRSRQGSTSVGPSSEEPSAEMGYDADLDNPDESHRSIPRQFSQRQHMSNHVSSPPSPRRWPNGQLLPTASGHHPQPPSPVSKPPTPPTIINERPPLQNSLPTGPRPTYIDRNGHVQPHPGPPPPLSPRVTEMPEDSSGTLRSHHRSGSDAGAERETALKGTEAQMDAFTHQWRSNSNKDVPIMSLSRVRNEHSRDARRNRPVAEDDLSGSSRESWVVVDVPDHPPQTRDGPRTSPTSLSRSPRTGQTSRFYSRGSAMNISKQSSPSVSSGNDSRPTTARPASKAVPSNYLVTWKGEDNTRKTSSSGASSSKTLSGKNMTKSMDNLRQHSRRAQPTPPFPPPRPRDPPAGYQPSNMPGIPKSFDNSRPFRPLPVQGSPHPSTSDYGTYGTGSNISISHVQQYTTRSTAYPSSSTGSNFVASNTAEPYPRPQSAADSPVTSPTHRTRPYQSPTYGPTLTSGESARSPRAVSPSRSSGLNGPRPLPIHSDRSDRSSDIHSGPETSTSSPPRTPTSPSSVNSSEKTTLVIEPSSPGTDTGTYIPTIGRQSELTLRQHDNANLEDLLKGVNAMMSREKLDHILTSPPVTQNGVTDMIMAVNDMSDSDEGNGGTWKVPLKRPPSARPELTPLQTNLASEVSIQSEKRDQPGPLPAPQYRPNVAQPRPGPRQPVDHSHRASTFADDRNNSDWIPRPLPEDVYDRLEDFFPEHDLDKPVIEANSGGNSPTNPEPAQPLAPPPSATSAAMATQIQQQERVRLRNTKKSIRLVAEEHKKRISDRASKYDINYNNAMLRKRNTKLWGSRLEEVDTMQIKGTPPGTIPESPSGGPTTFKWVRGELIGKGTYGRVYLALNATTGEMIAVKQVELPQTPSDKSDDRQATVVQALKMESETLKDLDHPHIVQYLGFEETPTNLSIFLEYVPGGSISSWLYKHGKFQDEVTRSFTGQILSGLEYLHSKGILHRDLKADNILVEMTGICKISDFGISKRTDDIYGGAFTAMQGTVFWMAPEVINTQKKGYNFKIDIWSVGCVVLEMWGGRRPWTGQEMIAVMFQLYAARLPPPVPDDVILSELADDFRLKCFAINPDERPSAAELRKHPYLELPPGWIFPGFPN